MSLGNIKKAKIGIASYEEQKKRIMAIACGEYKPKKSEPKIWFTSIESVAQALSTKNQELLKLIFECRPDSITNLAVLSGRKQGNLTRTLKTLERYGLIQIKKSGRSKMPVAVAGQFNLEFGVLSPSSILEAN
jgi:predicted transcriptional regulator